MPLTNYGEASILGMVFGNSSAQPTTAQSWNIGLITVKGLWTGSTAYNQNQLVIPAGTAFGTTATNRIFRQLQGSSGTSAASPEPTWTNTTSAYATTSTTYTGASTSIITTNSLNSSSFPSTGTITVASNNAAGYTSFTYTGVSVGSTQTTFTGLARVLGASGDSISSGVLVYSSVVDNTCVWADVTAYFYVYSNIASYEPTTTTSGYARATATNNYTGSLWATPSVPTNASPASTNYTTALSFGPSSGANASWGYVAGFFLIPSNGATTGPHAWNTLSNFVPILASGMTLTLPATTGVTVTLT